MRSPCDTRIEPANVSSRRLAAKLGFTEEGLLRGWLIVAGEFRSIVVPQHRDV